MTALRKRHAAAPIYLLEAEAAPGTRTQVHGALWDGVLNATPDDDDDGPSPVEALMAALVGCITRNIRSVTDSAHVSFERMTMKVAADRSDDPPAITVLRMDLAIITDVPVDRARRLVQLALRDATITRTLARGLDLAVLLTINDGPLEVLDIAWLRVLQDLRMDLDDPDVEKATTAAALLADPIRAGILRLLRNGPVCVCEMAAALGARENNISNHLARLRQAGLVSASRLGADSRRTYYERDEAACATAVTVLQALLR